VGYGFEGITDRSSDGQIFAQTGVTARTFESDGVCGDKCPTDTRHTADSRYPRVPGRFGLGLRVRVPFWLVPGDTILVAPFLLLSDERAFEKMGIVAVSGGIIPWQRVMLADIGTFQFIVGREVGLNLYGHFFGGYRYCAFEGPTVNMEGEPQDLYDCERLFTSWELDLPVVEYRPLRAFSSHLTSSFTAQAGLTVDVPTVINEDRATRAPDPGPSWTAYVRLGFDARLYTD